MGKFLMSLKHIERWFKKKQRILPWRDDPTLYRVWISEIMLQQTQVATVIPYFQKFIEYFPTVEKLAGAKEEEVLLLWSGLGYYSRARNLHKGAQQVVQNGFPKTRDEWLEVPGIGPYTAGAILSIASNQAEAILDGNIERVLSRVRCVSRQKGDAHFKLRLWKLSKIFVQKAHAHRIAPSVLNQALMELGATLCTPREPQCESCPLTGICRAYQQGMQALYPPKKKPKQWVHHQEKMHCLLDSKGRVLLRQRKEGEWRSGLWDLLDHPPQDLNLSAKRLGTVETRHVVTHHKIERITEVWSLNRAVNSLLLEASESNNSALKWVLAEDPQIPVGSALKKTLQKVLQSY